LIGQKVGVQGEKGKKNRKTAGDLSRDPVGPQPLPRGGALKLEGNGPRQKKSLMDIKEGKEKEWEPRGDREKTPPPIHVVIIKRKWGKSQGKSEPTSRQNKKTGKTLRKGVLIWCRPKKKKKTETVVTP